VLSSLLNAVQPILDRPLLRNLPLLISLFLAFSPLQAHPRATENTSLEDAVRQLAERVASIPNLHGPLSLQFFQDANFAADTGKEWQEYFRKELELHRLTLSDEPVAVPLRVGLAETPTQLVFSAIARVADKDEVRLITLPRISFRATNLPVAPVRIERQLVYQSSDRILDASSRWNGAEAGMALLAYQNDELTAVRLDGSGEVKQTVSLTPAAVHPSRDPRGELTVRANDAFVLLPGKSCEFSWTAATDVKCHSAKPDWRGATVLTPSCDAGGWKLLADGSGWTSPDSLWVIPDSPLREGSAALRSDFPGPILGINGEQNPASALVVTRNLRTGNYEVYKITLACGN
jgi:hypothetical protein